MIVDIELTNSTNAYNDAANIYSIAFTILDRPLSYFSNYSLLDMLIMFVIVSMTIWFIYRIVDKKSDGGLTAKIFGDDPLETNIDASASKGDYREMHYQTTFDKYEDWSTGLRGYEIKTASEAKADAQFENEWE